MSLHAATVGDAAAAAAYWRDKPFKKFAVDVTWGPSRRPTYAHTWYCRARTAERAIECVKREAWGIPRNATYRARLAGPDELGCARSA